MKDDSQDTPVSVPIDKGLGGSALSQRFHFRPYESVSVSDNEEPDFANEGSSQPFLQPGAPNSSNSQRLREVAEREGCPVAILAQRASDIDWARFEGIKSLGITAGASAPEVIVEEIMGAFAERYQLHVETVSAAEENEFFPLPRSLRPDAAAAE